MKKILYFSAAWCGPCKMLGPIMESVSDQVNYQKIDVDNNQVVKPFRFETGVPLTLKVDKNGKMYDLYFRLP